MITKPMPGTNLHPSSLCFGTGNMGSSLSESESFALLDAFVENGGNFLDSAHIYGDWIPGTSGLSEKTIGKWLKSRPSIRSRMVVATKGGHLHLMKYAPRLSPAEIRDDLEGSLQFLHTDYIDLYWLHRDDPSHPVAQIMDALNEHIRCGQIRYIGCSNWSAARIAEAQQYAERHGMQGFSANQMMWSLAEPNEHEIADKTMVIMGKQDKRLHRETGLSAVPYSSQARGFFSGNYNVIGEIPATPSGQGVALIYYNEVNFGRLARVGEIARRHGCSCSQVALAYLMSQPFPVFPIVGCHTVEQLADSCNADKLSLDQETLLYLENGLN